MKSIFSILLFVCFSKSQCQVKSGYVTYGESVIEMIIDTSKIKDDRIKDVIAVQQNSISKALSVDKEFYKLTFNTVESKFSKLPMINNESNPILKIALWPGVYYTNNQKKINIKQSDVFGETFLIVDNKKNYEWQLSSESKKIGKYICYKATTIIGKNNNKVIAWFTPEIPFSFGPFDFNGLPGLILELERLGRYYYSKKIVLNNSIEIKIKQPSKGIKVSKSEYNEIAKKMTKRLKRN